MLQEIQKNKSKHSGLILLFELRDDKGNERRFDFKYNLPPIVTLNTPPFLTFLCREKKLTYKGYNTMQAAFEFHQISTNIWVICSYLAHFLPEFISQG